MKLVESKISGELAQCSICEGIEQNEFDENGKATGNVFTLGAMADIDLFGMFTLCPAELDRWVTVQTNKGPKRMKVSGDLWSVQQKRGVKQKFEKVEKRVRDDATARRNRLEMYAKRVSAELTIFAETETENAGER